ncbi:sulfotransferase family protein [Qipengyuania psychrotolerans]|uniref:Sulfotransferase n=1 Tax=Qipengyuania psychrotolerans TaxID=2867238 RepID=A0ABX8ZAN4_9SPHN|nr:sulfotransferase [Qipengyuania psychrotolerans]QZD86033.1 sulfotransferase [Qipengyuania psychrotolerans]
MTAPTFFIAGAQKAGTTSLHAMLAKHPNVFMSTPKEPGYFIRGFDDQERWQTMKRPGPDGTIQDLSQVDMGVFTEQAYAAMFASRAAQLATHRGDASTPYFPSPNAARRIRETVPNARIIIALRDPVARAYSAWGYNSSRGNERALTFEEAVDEELSGGRDDWVYGWRYLYTGLYSQHLQRYLDAFGDERILLLKFEDFRADSQAVFDRICQFLEIPAAEVQSGDRENVTVQHKNKTLGAIRNGFNRPSLVKSMVKPLLSPGLRRSVSRSVTQFVDRFADRPERLSEEMRDRLNAYFLEDCRKLQSMVPFDISDWSPLAAKYSGGAHG